MQRLLSLAVVAMLSGCVVHERQVVAGGGYVAQTPVEVTVDTFEPQLSPYGEWIYVGGYGRAWRPSLAWVGTDFYPYATGGHWVLTDAGWVFDSEYPFGWATFHYGRWTRQPGLGWIWIPGRTWAPAWVSWRVGGPYIGWAPLSPEGELPFAEPYWCFVEANRFTHHHPYREAVPQYRFHDAVAVTQPVHDMHGPSRRWVAERTQEDIRPRPVASIPSSGRVVPPPPPAGRVTPPPPVAPNQGQVTPPPPVMPGQVPLPAPGTTPPAPQMERRGQPLDPGLRAPPPPPPAQPQPEERRDGPLPPGTVTPQPRQTGPLPPGTVPPESRRGPTTGPLAPAYRDQQRRDVAETRSAPLPQPAPMPVRRDVRSAPLPTAPAPTPRVEERREVRAFPGTAQPQPPPPPAKKKKTESPPPPPPPPARP